MKVRTRIFLAILINLAIGLSFFVYWVFSDIEPQFRESTEEPLVDAAWVLAGMASTQVREGVVDASLFREAFSNISREIIPARIYDFVKTNADLRVYLTDSTGKVVFDSAGLDEGADYSRRNDVFLTLQGKYGSRTSHEVPIEPDLSVMYIAAPIMADNRIIGVLAVGKPTRNVNSFVAKSKRKILWGSMITLAAVVIVTLVVSAMLTRPIERLTQYARVVSQGRREPLPALGGGEVGELGKAFEEMRTALEGKQYVENYVQTLTHEMKSPLAAISGAVELLKENMPPEQRERFLDNVESEVKRVQQLIQRLLLLSSLENRRSLLEEEELDLARVAQETAAGLAPLSLLRNVAIDITGESGATCRGEAFLVRQAVENLLRNALEFSPRGSTIRVVVTRGSQHICLAIEDQGPGIPDYALPRVFDRFYSLRRPDTDKKSSGLGLSIVREAMLLHNGTASVENIPEGGVRATLSFPA